MKTSFFLQSGGISETVPYKMGYQIGYFLGNNFYLVLILFIIMVATAVWFFFFRKKTTDN